MGLSNRFWIVTLVHQVLEQCLDWAFGCIPFFGHVDVSDCFGFSETNAPGNSSSRTHGTFYPFSRGRWTRKSFTKQIARSLDFIDSCMFYFNFIILKTWQVWPLDGLVWWQHAEAIRFWCLVQPIEPWPMKCLATVQMIFCIRCRLG